LPDGKAILQPGPDCSNTPEETLEQAADTLTRTLRADLLKHVHAAEPAFLERVVVQLLSAMGYGGGDARMAQVTGRTGDHGIDGKIREDALGLDEVYIQAKRYADGNTVGEGDLRNFAGALDAAGTVKGVFVTTSDFTRAALDYIEKSPKRIIPINGSELAALMVKHNIGVRVDTTYEVKRIDDDYFDGDMFG
ncbi:MAG: restriction endonuclease, partial [Rhodobacteraceae bacterium]|nr:restriction endonuclease [Paracoccaceae bacterium]